MFRRCLLGALLSAAAAVGAAPPVSSPTAPAPSTAAPAPAAPAPAAETPIVVPDVVTAPERALIRLQVLLDRAHFSPGVIDGQDGSNLKVAAKAYRKANKLPDNTTDEALTEKLVATDATSTVKHYTVTAEDVAGPFVPVLPKDMAELAKLDSPAYANATEELAERFHMDEALLGALNPGIDVGKAGSIIVVAAVTDDKLPKKVKKIIVDKSTNSVRAFDGAGELLAAYPATVGSTERPAPTGTWKVRTAAMKATYTFDPKRLTFGKKGEGKLTIKPGPNNPIGTTWIDLTKDTYGIHGTPDPRLIGKRASHGCVRLTNWDVQQLAKSVEAGTLVVFTGSEKRAKT